MTRTSRALPCTLLASLGLALACASTPPHAVLEAREELRAAERDPVISQHAAVQLEEARQQMARLERAASRGSDEELDHLAYLVRKRIEIARAAATAAALEDHIQKLAEERDNWQVRAAAQA